MADIEYNQHIEDLKKWLHGTVYSATNAEKLNPGYRHWCTLAVSPTLTAPDIHKYFSSKDLNKTYQDEHDKVNAPYPAGKFTNKPVAYLQVDSDGLAGLSKMYIYRHQPRLKNYRDDCENKYGRTYSSLSLSLAKLALLKKST